MDFVLNKIGSLGEGAEEEDEAGAEADEVA